MPELHFKGKEYVYNHHLTVPYRPLVAHPGKSILFPPLPEGEGVKSDKRHLVFAPTRFAPNKMLLPLGVEYAPLPFALYRFERD
jgi:hypothetical protein